MNYASSNDYAPKSAPEGMTEMLNRRLEELRGAVAHATERVQLHGNVLFGARPEASSGSTGGPKPVSICVMDRISDLEAAIKELHGNLDRFG